jgi:hypothetical protein
MSNGTPPIETAPVPPSIAGIPQPVFGSGSPTVPAAGAITGTPLIPPPPMADPVGVPEFPPVSPDTAPVPVPVGPLVGPRIPAATVPPSIPGVQQPQFVPPGSATVPASLFPDFTTTPPSPPIVFANIFKIGTVPPPLPSTPGQTPPPIVISAVPTIPQLPWPGTPAHPLPVNTVRPVVTGTPVVGNILSLSQGTWTNATSYAATWLRDGSPIAGATSPSYTCVAADVGLLLTGVITATGIGGEASAESLPVGPVPDPGAEEDPAPEDDGPVQAPARRAAPTRHSPTKRKR